MTLEPVVKHDAATSLKPASQYSLRSLLVSMVTMGMVLAYVRMFGERGIQLTALGLCAAMVWGCLLGYFSGRLVETLTWSLVGCVLGLCCVLSAERVSTFQQAHWVNVGVMGGAVAGFIKPGRWIARVTWSAGLWLCLGSVCVIFGDPWSGVFDMGLTLPVLIGLHVLVEVVHHLQERHHTALDVWAAGLVFAVIAGNFGAILVWNLWYA